MAVVLKESVRFEKAAEGEYLLDVKGYGCPHVQVYTEKALEKLAADEVLTVVFDNPSSSESVFYMCEAKGDEIVTRNEAAGTYTWTIRKA